VRRLVLLGIAAACLCAPLQAASAASPPRLVEANATFPHRLYVLTLSKRSSIVTGDVTVSENGGPVSHLSVTPAGAAGKSGFGTVLLIDASNSMRGDPIAGAMKAARAFAGRRNPGQKLALVTFNSSSNIVLPFTSDGTQITTALARAPQLAEGTHIYDAVQDAVGLVDRAGLKAATVVLVSDGADVGSHSSLKSAAAALRSHHIRLYSVGLKSGAFDAVALRRLAAAGGGTLSVATSPQSLAKIYDDLGFRLANEYLVQYDSLALPNRTINVHVDVAGFGAAAAGYRTPALPVHIQGPHHGSRVSAVLESWELMFVLVVLITWLLFFAFRRVIAGPASTIQARLGEFVSVTREDERRRREEVQALLRRRQQAARSSIGFWKTFVEETELIQLNISPTRVAAWAVATGLVLFMIAFAAGSALIGFFLFFVPPLVVRGYVRRKLKRMRAAFADQLADNLEVLASALRAGHSLIGGLAVVVEDAAEPSKTEFRRVLADEQLGVPLEDALRVTVRRMANRDLDQVAVIVVLQRDAGANSAEVLDQIVDNIRARQEIRRLVRVLTSQGRMARWIVSILPVGLLLIISLINPSYMHPMWHETIGHIFLSFAAIMIVCGSLIIGKIIDIDA
jgi:tight adherence protein B